jgi:hypothetical protein
MTKPALLTIPPVIDTRILLVRGRRVMLDSDLAKLYGVPTKALNQAVRRNRERFPEDFMFRLTGDEVENLRSQIVTSSLSAKGDKDDANLRFQIGTSSSAAHGGRRHPPSAFTQEGVAMLSSVLRSPRAIAVNIEIMRAFVRLRRLALSVKELAAKVDALEEKYDGEFGLVFEAIRELMTPPAAEDGVIGFLGKPKKSKSP